MEKKSKEEDKDYPDEFKKRIEKEVVEKLTELSRKKREEKK